MKMNKEQFLIPMTDFILGLTVDYNYKQIARISVKYAQFLKRPLKLGMFIPCDENDIMLAHPRLFRPDEIDLYVEAEKRILFEDNNYSLLNISEYVRLGRTIEESLYFNLKPNKRAIDMIFERSLS